MNAERIPRIRPLAEPEWTDEQRDVLVVTGGGTEPAVSNFYGTIVRHPRLHRRWVSFGAKLHHHGRLGSRDRELAVLRLAWRASGAYIWAYHVVEARLAGITDDEITRIRGVSGAPWPAHEEALLGAVDGLFDDDEIPGWAWTALAARLDDQQMIELPFLVGHYRMVIGVQRSLGIQLEPGVDPAGFGDGPRPSALPPVRP